MATGFKISSCTANYGQTPLVRVIDRMGELGFDGVEITVMHHAPPASFTLADRRDIASRIGDKGMAASGLHFIFPPGISMTSPDGNIRNAVCDHVKRVLDLAVDLSAPLIVVGGGGLRSIPADMDRATGLARVGECLSKIAEFAEETGVIACLEALNRYETNVGRTLSECRGLVDQVGSPKLKVAGDTFHMNIDERNLADALRETGDQLAHLHFVDSHRMAPGGGHIDFAPLLRALSDIDYRGYLSFEIFWIAPGLPYLPTYEQCDLEVSQAISYVRKLQQATLAV